MIQWHWDEVVSLLEHRMDNNHGENDLLLHHPPGSQFTQLQQGLPGLSTAAQDYFV